jgi:colicin import membrane protein
LNADAVNQGLGPILRPRSADGWRLGGALALGVHLMLVAALALGVRWKMTTPETVAAEMWAEIPMEAAPDAPPPPPPVDLPKVAPPPVEAPPEPEKALEPEPPAPEPIADVVVDSKPKKEPKKEPNKRKHQEPREVFISDEPKPAKKSEKVAPKKPEVAKSVPSKFSSTDSNATAAAKRDAQHKAAGKDIMDELVASLGSSTRSAAPTAAYTGRIIARVKPNITFTETLSGDPVAVVEVQCAPDGRIIARKLIDSSSVRSWDEAVLRAIDKTEVLPKNESGQVPSSMQLVFHYKNF